MATNEPQRSSHPKNAQVSPIPAATPQDEILDYGESPSKEHAIDTHDITAKPHPSLAREILFIAIICSSQLLTQSGLALSIVPQHIIARSFGIDDRPGEVSWFSAGYSLTVGTFILIAGRLGDVFGYKRFFVGGFVWFAL